MEPVSPYEYFDNQLGVQARFIFDGGRAHATSLRVIGYTGLQKRVEKQQLVRLRVNSPNNPMLISFASLPYNWQKALIQAFGEPQKQARKSLFAQNYVQDTKALEFYLQYTYGEGLSLPSTKVEEYTLNASVLNLLHSMRTARKAKCKGINMSTAEVWTSLVYDCNNFRATTPHTLPENADRLGRKLAEYMRGGYAILIHGMYGATNAKKVKTREQNAFIEELLGHHNNFDNQQIANLYNMLCEKLNWQAITAGTVENYRKSTSLASYAGTRGETQFRNNKAMLVKRSAPKLPMRFWCIDGWDAELLYQADTEDKKGRKVITYHNRLTIVIVLDPCTKYPVGYAIGTHETPQLIRAAIKNALQHTKELFGDYYMPNQFQSDNYGRGSLTELYKDVTKHYTPARVKNSKAKVIEPYFKYFNKTHCQTEPNWSGFGITSRKESQPNDDYLNAVKKDFPNQEGCAKQLHDKIALDRAKNQEQYKTKWAEVAPDEKLPMSTEHYLLQFGDTTGFTNRIEAMGLCPTILGEKRTYDCFETAFRTLAHIDWVVKYEPSDLTSVLAESKDGTHRFILQEKYVQPMALIERQDGDAKQLQAVEDFNKKMMDTITERRTENYQIVQQAMESHPELDTLKKLMITNSRGQHKNEKNLERSKVKAKAQVIEVIAEEVDEVMIGDIVNETQGMY